MAELNGYPGPRHILDLNRELKLSSNQILQIETVFKQMQTDAKGVGQQIVNLEIFDCLFTSLSILIKIT